MKILIIQLARLGDIYMTWPIVRALVRQYPSAAIDILVRERFSSACEGIEGLRNIYQLKSAKIIERTIESVQDGIDEMGELVNELAACQYTHVYNLSFSPLSSFITYGVSKRADEVRGYTRFDDSSFALTDNISAYYFSHVGLEKSNRFHIIDLFATLVGVDLVRDDFHYPTSFSLKSPIQEKYITIQLGASNSNKTLTPFIWSRAIKHFLSYGLSYKVVLIGSQEERVLAHEIYAFNSQSDLINLMGKTSVKELFPILKNSSLHIGGDSVGIQIANLCGTPCLNLSFESVKFWETGPRARGSFVLLNMTPSNTESKEVSLSMRAILLRETLPQLIPVIEDSPCFDVNTKLIDDFEWNLLKALYLGNPFPITDDILFFKGIEKLNQTNDLIIQTLESCKLNGVARFVSILTACDQNFVAIRKLSPRVGIFIDWCLAEKIRIPPLTENEIVESYLKVHNELKVLVKPYTLDDQSQDEVKNHG